MNGTPFLANTVSAVFSPLHWLLIMLPLNLFYEWSAFLKLLLAGSGIYFFCRRIQVPESCAAVAGAVYILGGYNIFFLLFPNTWLSALLGWGLLALEDFLQTASRKSLALFSLILGFAYLGGHVESALLSHLAYGLYALLRNWRRLAAVLGASLLGFFLAAVALFPFMEFLFQSATYLQRSAPIRNPFFVSPGKWPALIIPYFLGAPVGQTESVSNKLVEGVIYLGIIPVVCIFFSFSNTSLRKFSLPLSIVVLWSGTILFGVPLLFDLFTALPVMKQGSHFHIAQIFHASAAILGGIGLSAIKKREFSASLYFVAAGVSLILVLISGYWQFLPGWTQEAANGSFFFFYRRFSVPLYPFWVGLTLAILIGSLRSRRSPQIVLALVVLNGWIFGMFFNPVVSAGNTVDVTPPAVEVLKHYPHERVAGIGIGTLQPNYSMR